jgi:hypothetical protein
MSVFQVKLKSAAEGQLDTQVDAGGNSLQRQAYIMGPKRINRLMVDGEQFSDCNYYKQFCTYNATSNPEGCDAAAAILLLVSDDGAPYSSVPSEQTFAWSTVAGGVDAGDAVFATIKDFATDFGSYAVSAIISNISNVAATIRINGTAEFSLASLATQVFNTGDLVISKIEAKVTGAAKKITVFAGVKSVSNS